MLIAIINNSVLYYKVKLLASFRKQNKTKNVLHCNTLKTQDGIYNDILAFIIYRLSSMALKKGDLRRKNEDYL